MNVQTKKAEGRIDHRDATRTALILAGLFWLILLYPTNFDAAMSEKLRRVLGGRPEGLSYDLYILLFTLQLSFPMIFFFRALVITRTYARKRQGSVVHAGDAGAVVGLLGYLRYLVKDTGEGPQIRRSKLITLAGILYMIGIVVWWILWTSSHGI